MEDLKEGLVIPGFLFVDEPYKALPLTAKVVLGLLIGCMRPDKEAAGEKGRLHQTRRRRGDFKHIATYL